MLCCVFQPSLHVSSAYGGMIRSAVTPEGLYVGCLLIEYSGLGYRGLPMVSRLALIRFQLAKKALIRWIQWIVLINHGLGSWVANYVLFASAIVYIGLSLRVQMWCRKSFPSQPQRCESICIVCFHEIYAPFAACSLQRWRMCFVLRSGSPLPDNLFRDVVVFLQHGQLKSTEIVNSQGHTVLTCWQLWGQRQSVVIGNVLHICSSFVFPCCGYCCA